MNIEQFWKDVLEQNAEALKMYFHEDAFVNWHCTNEHFTAAEFIRANCEYPGDWAGEIEKKLMLNDLIITVSGIILETSHVEMVHYDRVGHLCVLSLADYNHMMNENKTLENGECLLYSDSLDLLWETFTMEYGETYSVKERLSVFREDGGNMVMAIPYVYLVVPDVDAFVAPVAGLQNSSGYSMVDYKWLLGFDCATAEEELAVKDKLYQVLIQNSSENRPWSVLSLESREEERSGFYEIYGSLFFLGIMLSVVFLMAAVLIIYYKQISEGYEDQSRFEIMQKVGMTKKDIRKSINSQMLTVFFLPLCLAGLHLGFAFPCLSKILKMFAFDNLFLNAMVTLGCFAVFGVFYGIVYKITSGSYYAIVSGRKEK